MIGPMDAGDLIADPAPARLAPPHVGAGRPPLGERLDPAALAQPAGEVATGNPGDRHLEDQAVADPPALTDAGAGDVEAGRGHVFAEGAAGQRPIQVGGPGVHVLPGVCVNRLVVAPVMAQVADLVADQPAAADAARAGRTHLDRLGHRALVDARDALLVALRARSAQVDGLHQSHDGTLARGCRLANPFWPASDVSCGRPLVRRPAALAGPGRLAGHGLPTRVCGPGTRVGRPTS